MRRITKKFLTYLIPTLIVLVIIPITFGDRFWQGNKNPFGGLRIRCAIQLGDFDTFSSGYLTGYNYELLKRFARDHSADPEIYLADNELSFKDSLRLDRLDILVLPASDTGALNGLSVFYAPDSLSMWVIKSDRNAKRSLDKWQAGFRRSHDCATVYDRFFHGYNPWRKSARKPGILSPYDDVIRQYSRQLGWDWMLVAALIWNESRFRIQARSPRGAAGLMQMMPRTARRFDLENALDPEESIKAGTGLLVRLQKIFREYTSDPDDLVKFTLGAYNAGEGRILECIRLAQARGMETVTWDNLLSVIPEVEQKTVQSGTEDLSRGFLAQETAAYVRDVLRRYAIFSGTEPESLPGKEPGENDEAPEPEESLGADSLGRVDPGDEETGDEKQGQDDDVSQEIG